MPSIDHWRSLRDYAIEEASFDVGDLVHRKDQSKNERTHYSKVGIILAVDETSQAWIKMAKVMWNGTSDIEEVATIYLQRIPQEDDTN